MALPTQRVETSEPRLRPRPSGVRDLLRARTSDEHAALEATPLMREFARGMDDPRYAHEYLSRQYRLHRACEAALSAIVPPDLAAARLAKSGWLAEDLRSLGLPVDGRPVVVPAVDDWASALGMLYVLEGSTLGLQKIRRELVTAGSTGWPVRSRFVRGYGDATGARWREFLLLVEVLPAAQWPAAVAAATGTFGAFLDTFREAIHD